MSSRWGPVLITACLYLVLTFLFTHPLLFHFTTHHVGEPGGDAPTYLWNYWWVGKALKELHTDPFETDYIFYPQGIGLALHTLGLAQGLAFTALETIAGPVAGANAIVVWTFLASSLGMYVLARYLGASRLGAFLSGIVFGFCPPRLARLAGHYDLLGTEWIPLYTLALLAGLRAQTVRWKVLMGAGVLAALTGYTALNYLVFLVFITPLIAVWVLGKSPARFYSMLGRSALIGGVTAALLLPLLVHAARDLNDWSYPPYPGSERYGANVAAYFTPGPAQTFLGDVIGRRFEGNATEATVFPGYVVLIVTVAALLRPNLRRRLRFWLASAAVFFIASLGSTLKVGDWTAGVPLPYAIVDRLPLLHHLRAPSRFSILVLLCLAVVFGSVWTRWLERIHRPSVRIGLTATAAVVLVVEYLAVPIPIFAAGATPIYEHIGECAGDFTVVEIPGIDQIPARLMYNQTVHGKRIFIGSAARVPREKMDYYFGIHLVRPLIDLRKGRIPLTPELIERERAVAPLVARFLDIGYFVVDREYEKRGVRNFLTEVLPVEVALEDDRRVLLRVQREDLPPLPTVIDADGSASRLFFETGWSRPEEEATRRFRWADRPRSTVLLRRPSSPVRDLVLVVAPLEGSSQTVEARISGLRLGTRTLRGGWAEIRWPLPPPSDRVERLELRWSELRRASTRDPRRLAARVAQIRFE